MKNIKPYMFLFICFKIMSVHKSKEKNENRIFFEDGHKS